MVRNSSADLNVPSEPIAVLHGMLLAPGMWPPRCAVSVMPGGAITLPVYSSGLRTSTRFERFSDCARSTSGNKARRFKSGSLARYCVGTILGRSVVNSLSGSFNHFTLCFFVYKNKNNKKPKRGEPVVVVPIQNHCLTRGDACSAEQLFEFLLADDVAADLVLKLALPVEADRTGDVARVVGFGVHIDLDKFDSRLTEVLLDPVGFNQNFGMGVFRHRLVTFVSCGSSSGMCLIM